MRLEKPHSLSYHDSTRTHVLSSTWVCVTSKVELCGSWLKSTDTVGALLMPTMPFNRFDLAASSISELVSSAVVSRFASNVKSINDTFAVGTAIRVPTANVSLIDFTFDAKRETTADEVNSLMEEAAKSNRLKGIVGINKAPTVSVDFNHDPHSSTFDVTQTQVLDKTFVRVLSWYDNEWGFYNRMVELPAYFAALHSQPDIRDESGQL